MVNVLRAGQQSSDALRTELIEFCQGKPAVYKLLRDVEFIDRIPRAAGPGTGKLLCSLVREREP